MKNLLVALFFTSAVFTADISGREVINNMLESNKILTSSMNIELYHSEMKRGKEKIKVRKLVRYHKTYPNGDYKSKSLYRFITPEIIKDAGFLVWAKRSGGNDQWLFLPKVKTAKKIEAQEKTKSFMNTEFSYEDLESFNQPDEQYFLTGEESIENINCYKIEIIGHSNTQYKKRIAYISVNEWLLKKVEFYDKQNKLFKILTINEYQNFESIKFTKKMTMVNKNTGSKTVMEISDFECNIDFPDGLFTIDSLINP